MKHEPRIVITVEGGVIQNISANGEVKVMVIDYDTDGLKPDELKAVPQTDGRMELASVYVDNQSGDAVERVNELFALLDTP